ncbi:MAG: hypothetical protein EOP83_14690 [Verrucomicrobiaceae bacterium]|nr:MAG: hypothetical protein EOP83_14690 [Verrucomicrobiaceae bacterium]
MKEFAIKISGPYTKYDEAMNFLGSRLGTHETSLWRRDVPEVEYDPVESDDDYLSGYFYIRDRNVAFEFKMIFG